MTLMRLRAVALHFILLSTLSAATFSALAADQALLDILLGNGVITQAQYDELMKKPQLTSQDFGLPATDLAVEPTQAENIVDEKIEKALDEKFAARDKVIDDDLDNTIQDKIAANQKSM